MWPQQYQVFMLFWNARGERVTRDELADVLWGHNPCETFLNAANVYLHRLRRLLAPTRFRIVTEGHNGWRLTRLPALRLIT